MKSCSFSQDGMAPHLQEDTAIYIFFLLGTSPSCERPHQLFPKPLWVAQADPGAAGRVGFCHTGWDGVTQGGTVSPCSSAPLQPPEDWGQLERFSPSPGGGNHSTAFPAGSSGTGQERKGQVICGSRNPASPGFILGKISCLFPAQLFVVYGQ